MSYDPNQPAQPPGPPQTQPGFAPPPIPVGPPSNAPASPPPAPPAAVPPPAPPPAAVPPPAPAPAPAPPGPAPDLAKPSAAPPPPAAGGPPPPQMSAPATDAGPAPMMMGTAEQVLSQFQPKPAGQRFTLQNGKMLRVSLGADVLASKGSMVAYQGQIEFDHQGSGMKGFMKKAVTGEGMSLMRCRGQGDVYFAVASADVTILTLHGDAITCNGTNVLAFDADSIAHDIKMVQGAGGIMGGGLFNVFLQGQGQVALMTRGTPVVLPTHQAPTFVDAQAVVAWSANLQTFMQKSFNVKALIGKGSGEAFQMGFQGQGWVLVQPDEGMGTRGGIGGAAGGGGGGGLGGMLRG
jgi:uncharacterized protein (AIM24 family)